MIALRMTMKRTNTMRKKKSEVRGARCEVRGARCEVRGARCEVRGAKNIFYFDDIQPNTIPFHKFLTPNPKPLKKKYNIGQNTY